MPLSPNSVKLISAFAHRGGGRADPLVFFEPFIYADGELSSVSTWIKRDIIVTPDADISSEKVVAAVAVPAVLPFDGTVAIYHRPETFDLDASKNRRYSFDFSLSVNAPGTAQSGVAFQVESASNSTVGSAVSKVTLVLQWAATNTVTRTMSLRTTFGGGGTATKSDVVSGGLGIHEWSGTVNIFVSNGVIYAVESVVGQTSDLVADNAGVVSVKPRVSVSAQSLAAGFSSSIDNLIIRGTLN